MCFSGLAATGDSPMPETFRFTEPASPPLQAPPSPQNTHSFPLKRKLITDSRCAVGDLQP
jgi:hypothetical protein